MNMIRILALLIALGFSTTAAGITVDASFPGGNIVVEKIEGDTVTLRSDLRNTKGYWFYWCFQVSGAEGRQVVFQFTDEKPVGVRGPAVSLDGGQTWAWHEKDFTQNRFAYTFPNQSAPVRFGVGMTYTEVHWKKFLAQHAGDSRLKTGELCRSRKGRVVETASIEPVSGSPAHQIILTSRHHACEMMASYTLEGFIDQVLADDDAGRWLAKNATFFIVPFVDKDGVEEGDQGKNRDPRDHNRDYDGKNLYPETRAIRERMPAWSQGPPMVTIDLHCPWISGDTSETIYQVGRKDPLIWKEQQKFGRLLESIRRGPLPYRQSDDLPFGKAWNTDKNSADGLSFSQWALAQPGVKFAVGLEIPYANAGGVPVTAESARAFGRDLACAIKAYLEVKD